jgi:hypothetical protein
LYRALSFRRKLLHRFVRQRGTKGSYGMTKRGTKRRKRFLRNDKAAHEAAQKVPPI